MADEPDSKSEHAPSPARPAWTAPRLKVIDIVDNTRGNLSNVNNDGPNSYWS